MARVFNGTNQYLKHGSAAPVAYGPMSVAIWFNKDALTQNAWIFYEGGGGGYWRGVWISSTGYARAYWRGADTRYVESTNIFGAASWNHLGGVWKTKTVQSVYLNGTATTNDQYSNGGGMTWTSLGASYTGGTPFDGKLFWFTQWDVILSASEFASLAAGAHPYLIRPDSIVQHIPFGGLDVEDDVDRVERNTFNAYNSPTWSDDSPAGLIYPSQQIIGVSQGIITPPPQYNQRQILLKNRMSIQNSRLLIGK